jgi:hypothetical protein
LERISRDSIFCFALILTRNAKTLQLLTVVNWVGKFDDFSSHLTKETPSQTVHGTHWGRIEHF